MASPPRHPGPHLVRTTGDRRRRRLTWAIITGILAVGTAASIATALGQAAPYATGLVPASALALLLLAVACWKKGTPAVLFFLDDLWQWGTRPANTEAAATLLARIAAAQDPYPEAARIVIRHTPHGYTLQVEDATALGQPWPLAAQEADGIAQALTDSRGLGILSRATFRVPLPPRPSAHARLRHLHALQGAHATQAQA